MSVFNAVPTAAMQMYVAASPNPIPKVGPNVAFPGMEYLVLALDVFLGVILIGLVGLFFVGLIKLIAGFANRRNEGAGMAIAMMISSVIALVITIGGGVFLNRWIGFFG